MLNSLSLFIYHAVSGLRRTGINALVDAGNLQQNVVDVAINEWRKRLAACVQMDDILSTIVSFS